MERIYQVTQAQGQLGQLDMVGFLVYLVLMALGVCALAMMEHILLAIVWLWRLFRERGDSRAKVETDKVSRTGHL